MMRTLKAALVSLILAAAFVPIAAGAPDWRAKVPSTQVKFAYFMYRGVGAPPDHVTAENVLRAEILTEPDPMIDRNLAWVQSSDWPAGFKTLFAGAVRWTRTTRQLGPDELYRLSREFFAQPKAEERFFASIASSLRGLAASRGHKRARQEQDEWVRNHKHVYTKAQHERMMAKVAKGDPVAMYLLAGRYEDAEGLKRDLAKAYYWMLRARANVRDEKTTKDVALALHFLERDTKPEERRRALNWLETGIEPPI